MKKVLSLAMVIIMTLIATTVCAEESENDRYCFPADVFELIEYLNSQDDDRIKIDYGEVSWSLDHVWYPYDDMYLEVDVDVKTRQIKEVKTYVYTWNMKKNSDLFYNHGLLYGALMLYLCEGEVGSEEIISGLGLEELDVEKDKYEATVVKNGNRFEAILKDGRFELSLSKIENRTREHDVNLFDAMDLLESMKNHEGVKVGEVEEYNENSDLNQLLGKDDSYGSKLNFTDLGLSPNGEYGDSIDVQEGGSIEIFYNEKDACARVNKLYSI